MTIFSYCHSATYWQQEVTVLHCNKPPRDLRTSIIYGQSNLKAFVMLNCEDPEFSLKGVSVAA